MAPEQLEGKETDHRVDVFAFGAVLHELLTGTAAFRGASQASLIASILTSEPTSVSSLQPVTPPILDHLVSRSLAKDPNERWTSMHDVWLQLRWIATQPLAPTATAVAAPLGRRERRWWMAAIASLLLAAATAAVWRWPNNPEVPAQIQLKFRRRPARPFKSPGLASST